MEHEEFIQHIHDNPLKETAAEVLFDAEMIMLELGDGEGIEHADIRMKALTLGGIVSLLLCYAGKYEEYQTHPSETLHSYKLAQQLPSGLQ